MGSSDSLGMKLLTIVLALFLLGATGFVWRNATVSVTPEAILRALIVAEHERVCGAGLSGSTPLTWMARYRSMDMLNNGYFAHKNPWTGRTVFNLMTRAGIPYATGSEILVWNTYADDVSASVAYRQFMGSTPHRAAIRACSYVRMGVGAYKVGAKHMYTVVFAR